MCSLAIFVSPGPVAAQGQPNILWITSEDNSTYLGCYGDPNANTPNLDKLAARGVRYSRCFANAPVCAVARSSWILGVSAATSGTHHMRSWYRIPDTLVPYPTLLREAGYFTSNRGKTDYNTSSFEKEIWDECGSGAHYRNRQPGQPFFAVFNIKASHESGVFPERVEEGIRRGLLPEEPAVPAAAITVPPYQVSTRETIRDWRRLYDQLQVMDEEVGRLLRDLEEGGAADDTIIVYCSDHSGITLRTKRYLYDSGTRVPLIVVVPPKWSSLAAGKPGSVSDRLVQFIDMPRTFLSLAGVRPPERMTGRVFLGPGTEPAPDTVFLFSGRFDESPDTRRGLTDGRWKYIRNYEPDRPRFQMLLYPLTQLGQQSQWREFTAGRTSPDQSAHYLPQAFEELYDTRADPHEVHNLASEQRHQRRLARLRHRLDRHILDSRDTGFIPEPMMEAIDQDLSTTVFEFAQSDANYPLERILEFANHAARKDLKSIAELCKALKDPNPIMRYWAIVGLRVLVESAAPAEADVERALQDPEPSVRVTAAVTLGNLGRKEEAIAFLLDEARSAVTDMHANWALDGIKYLDAPDAVGLVQTEAVAKGRFSRRNLESLRRGGTLHQPPGKEVVHEYRLTSPHTSNDDREP